MKTNVGKYAYARAQDSDGWRHRGHRTLFVWRKRTLKALTMMLAVGGGILDPGVCVIIVPGSSGGVVTKSTGPGGIRSTLPRGAELELQGCVKDTLPGSIVFVGSGGLLAGGLSSLNLLICSFAVSESQTGAIKIGSHIHPLARKRARFDFFP